MATRGPRKRNRNRPRAGSDGDFAIYRTLSGREWISNLKASPAAHFIADKKSRLFKTLNKIRWQHQRDPETAAKSRGLIARSFVDMGATVSEPVAKAVSAPLYVKRASSFKGKQVPKMANGSVKSSQDEYSVTLKNVSRAARGASYSGAKILQSSIARRRSAITKDIQKGFFASAGMEKIKRRYKLTFQ